MSEISNVNGNEAIHLYNEMQAVEEKAAVKEEVVNEAVSQKDIYQVANAIADILEAKQAEKDAAKIAAQKQPEAKKTELSLKDISRKDLDKKDHKLVKNHVQSHAKNIQWDKSKNVVVIEKSGKFRAYKIGAGAAPAIKEGTKKEVTSFLKSL